MTSTDKTLFKDTICALATPFGGAIGIIRLSGNASISIADKIFRAANGKTLSLAATSTIIYGQLQDNDATPIDDVLVSVFRAPHSYTGEDSVEISCHGSRYILQHTLECLIKNGARQANPGEYTERAFLNGKIDLCQAEAVADLVSSTNAATHRLALGQLRGGFSNDLIKLRDELLKITSLLELELDFSEEDVTFANRSQLRSLACKIQERIQYLIASFRTGNSLKNGVPVAIIGETNVGKSTLLNQLLHEDKAIVSNIHGTTRDTIEDTVSLQGITFRFIDTAGIRKTNDLVENMGIERTWQKVNEAEIILWLTDGNETNDSLAEMGKELSSRCKNKTLIHVHNKCDLHNSKDTTTNKSSSLDLKKQNDLYISAKIGTGIVELQQQLVLAADLPEITQNNIIVTNVRHYQALSAAAESLDRVITSLDNNISGDLISEDLRACIFHLSEIIGGEITQNSASESDATEKKIVKRAKISL
jgi:tRNA modification GTPase